MTYPVLAHDFGPAISGPFPGAALYALAIQLDGKVLIGGNFTNVAGEGRDYIARLNADGTLDTAFNPGAKGVVYGFAVQPDGKILVAGAFTNICQQVRNRIARLNPDGSLDLAFNPGANSVVYSLVLLPSGKILVGGSFSQIGGQSRSGVARLNPDGTVDTAFNAGSIMNVYSLAAQPDGRILVGGAFSSVGGQQRVNLARLSADGLLDASFKPDALGGAPSSVRCLSVKPDGKVIVAGSFTILSGQTRNNIGRLNVDGSLDGAFDPNANSVIYSIAQQADGGILIGGGFTTVGGQPRERIARLNADGTVDERFNASATSVYTIALLPEGGVLLGGAFPIVAPANGNRIRRLDNGEPATQTLAFDASSVTWLRGGTSPEAWRTTFEFSTNGFDWFSLGAGTPVPGGWRLSGTSLPPDSAVRARGLVTQSYQGGASWLVEAIAGWPAISTQPVNRTNNAGTVASFTVLGGGTSPLILTWLKNGAPLADGASVSGAHTPTLTLSNVLRADEGVYSLVLSNSIGVTTSAVATLTVLDPAINRHPVSQIVNVGQPLRLTVEAGGTPPLNYQWRKNGNDLVGATESTYSVPAAQWPDGANYDVTVQNELGGVTSLVAAVSINMAPPDTFAPALDSIPYTISPQLDSALLLGGAFRNLGGQSRKALGRLWADGTLDASFDARADGVPCSVYALAFQEDGAILVGGDFSSLGGQPRYYLGRLNAKGSLDTNFVAGASSGSVQYVNCVTLQRDGKILVGGFFSLMGGQSRSCIARLNPDGTADPSFNLVANGAVRSMVVQSDGKIVVGGSFTTLGGQPCSYLGRLNPDGTRDSGFNPAVDNGLNCVALQSDGKILVGGVFSTVGGAARNYLARLNADGTLDADFRPVLGGARPSGPLFSIALQADEKILLAGSFNTLNGERRECLGRLNPDGTLDATFNVPATGGTVPLCYALSLQLDGSVLVSGAFTSLGGETHTNVGRLRNSEPATQALNYNDSTLTWSRGGSSPELSRAWFEATTNGLDWISLGEGSRIAGGWQRADVAAPPGAFIRARGFASGGMYNSSTYLVESSLPGLIPHITTQPQSRTLLLGADLVLSVGVEGTESFSCQWWFQGAPLPGQTNDTLSLLSVQRTNSGTYSVVVSNEFGTATSEDAIVRVLVPPVLELPSLLSDGTLRLQFRDSDGALPTDLGKVSVQWRTNLPSGTDTNWQVLTSGFYLTNGFIVTEDTNTWSLPSRFYRVLEQ